jgi:glycosyltransferase 2 family protein
MNVEAKHPARRIVVWMIAAVLLTASAAYIVSTFQWGAAFGVLANADPAWFFLGGGGAIVAYWGVRALRWRYLMGGMGARAPFLDLYLCSSVALSLSVFTPLQSGEALKVELLKRYGRVSRLPGYSAFALERVADLYVVGAIGVVALVSASSSTVYALLLAGLFIGLPVAGYIVLHNLRLPGRGGEFVALLQSAVRTPEMLLILLVLTVASWALVALGWHACLLSISIRLGFLDMLGLLSVVTLAGIVSLIPGGLGVAEASVAEFLMHYGLAAPLAQAGALCLRGHSLLVILLGGIHLLALRARSKHSRCAARAEAR